MIGIQRLGRAVTTATHLGLFEIKTLLFVLAIAGSAWAFAGIAEEVREGETRGFDEAVLLSMRVAGHPDDPIGPRWFEEACRDVTALGGLVVLVLLTLSSAVYLLMARRPRVALLLLISVLGAQLLSSALKYGFERPRPELVPHEAYVYTASFPSGHSVMSAATYLTLAALLAQVQPHRRLKAFILGLAVAVVVLIGLSRVYLGVHWPTDVLAGWTVGAGWAALVWLVSRILQRLGALRNAAGQSEIPPAAESSPSSDVS